MTCETCLTAASAGVAARLPVIAMMSAAPGSAHITVECPSSQVYHYRRRRRDAGVALSGRRSVAATADIDNFISADTLRGFLCLVLWVLTFRIIVKKFGWDFTFIVRFQ